MGWVFGSSSSRISALALCLVLCGGCAAHRVRGDFLDAGGVPLHYTVEGAGTPVVLVHGVAINADLNWRRTGIIRALARDYRVIAFDNRGHGRSGKPRGQQHYGAELVADVIRLMDHLDIDKAHLVGYSLGGFITLKALEEHPDRLLSAAPCGAGWERRDAEGLRRLEAIADAIESRGDYGPLLEEVGFRRRGLGRVKVFAINRYFRCINNEEIIADVLRSLSELEVSEEALRNNRVPVLSIVGDADPLKRGVDAMDGILGRHETVIIPRGTHYSTLNKRQLVSALKTFLEKHGDDGP